MLRSRRHRALASVVLASALLAAARLARADPPGVLELTVRPGSGVCGLVSGDTAGTQPLLALGCGTLHVGGGSSVNPPGGSFPEGSTSRVGLAGCAGDVCTVSGLPNAADGADCTEAGCPFGFPMPVDASPSVCLVHSIAAAPSGSIDLATGVTSDLAVSLESGVFLGSYVVDRGQGDVVEPCPTCVNGVDLDTGFRPLSGSPGDPQTGVCGGGPRAGQPCTTRNPAGLTRDCLPGGWAFAGVPLDRPCDAGEACIDDLQQQGFNFGTVALAVSPLGTGPVAAAAESAGSAAGAFCLAQPNPGCFGAEFAVQLPGGPATGADCRHIGATGSPFGDLRSREPRDGTLASVFCVPPTANVLVNAAGDLPGPGAVTLAATLRLVAAGPPASTTTTLPPSSTTTTSTSAPSTTASTSSTSTTTSMTPTTTSSSSTTTSSPTTSTTAAPSTTSTTTTSSTARSTSTTSTTVRSTTTTLLPAVCGNGVVEPGEACEPGAGGACCSASCAIAAAGTPCRAAAGACDVEETCDGARAACPADAAAPDQTPCDPCEGAVCRAGTCSVPAVCERAVVLPQGSPTLVGATAAAEVEVALAGDAGDEKPVVTVAGFVASEARAATPADGVQVTKTAKTRLTRRRPRQVVRLRLNKRGKAMLKAAGTLRVVLVVRVRTTAGTSTFRIPREWRR